MKKIFLLFFCLTSFCVLGPVSAELLDIQNEELQTLIEEGVPVIDVRRADEWRETGVIEGSLLLTFFDRRNQYDAQKWLTEMSELINPEEPFVLICHSGVRSHIVGEWLGKQFKTVYQVEKGISHWIKDGNVTVAPAADSSDS